MDTIFNTAKQFRFYAATLALAVLVIAVAVASTSSPIMAQTDSESDPKPCGPTEGTVQKAPPPNPDASVSRGHYAIFDGYWDLDDKVLKPNLCPPSVVHTTTETRVGFDVVKTTTSTRSASNIDLSKDKTVIHIDDNFQHTLTAAEVEKYDFFKLGDSGDDDDTVDDAIGQTVWWLKADDDTTETGTEPEFHLGFSAALFDPNDWYLAGGDASSPAGQGAKPLQYEFEVIREPGIPVEEQGHLFAFDDSVPVGDAPKTADWDSSEVDANALPLYPRDYYHYQWAFTKPGTYIVSVQLKGHVRQKNDPRGATAPTDWNPISDKRVETGEVLRYVFQVGPLTLNEEPVFEVERTVEENSAVGTLVGDPIPVYQGDEDTLTFSLSGPGHTLFNAEADENGDAQIKVAEDANLNYEAFGDDPAEYQLTLGVSDKKDHESNADEVVDSVIAVKIRLTDVLDAHLEVAENSTGGTLVGEAIVIPDADSSTTYSLSGEGSDLFTVERNSSNNAQIKVADGAHLNYEDGPCIDLTMHFTIGGVAFEIRIFICLTDVADETLAITLVADPSGSPQVINTNVELTGTVTVSPVATSELRYALTTVNALNRAITVDLDSPATTVTSAETGTRTYYIGVSHREGSELVVREYESNPIVINWVASQGSEGGDGS